MYNHKKYQKEWRKAHKEYGKNWFKKNKNRYKERFKSYILKGKYGISLKQYKILLKKQNNCCKICGKHKSKFKRSLAVDHDHKTKIIRGLLCHHCNYGLGHFYENIFIMKKAISYLKNLHLDRKL